MYTIPPPGEWGQLAGRPPRAAYVFKHALIQEAAYQSLLRSMRQQYHQRIAQVLEARFPDLCETQPELLAHHYTEAGLLAQAIPYWQQAGQRALRRSANVEAIAHLAKGLDVLKILPESPARSQRRERLGVVTPAGSRRGLSVGELDVPEFIPDF